MGLGRDLSPSPSVGLSVRRVYCGKVADWISVLFGVVSGIVREMGVLDGVYVPQGGGLPPSV